VEGRVEGLLRETPGRGYSHALALRYCYGMCVSIACVFELGYSFAAYHQSSPLAAPTTFYLASLASFSLTALAIACARLETHLRKRTPLIGSFITSALGGALVTLVPAILDRPPSVPMLIIGGALTGLGTAYVFVRYQALLAEFDARTMSILVTATFAGACTLMLIFALLPRWLDAIACPILAVSPVLLLPSIPTSKHRHQSFLRDSLKDTLSPITKVLFAVCLFGVVFGFQRGVYSHGMTGYETYGSALFFLAFACLAGGLLVFQIRRDRSLDTTRFLKVAVVVDATGLLLLPYSSDLRSLAASSLVAFAYMAFQVIVWPLLDWLPFPGQIR